MTSKERVLRLFRGDPVDRVACFEQTIACTVASDILGRPALTSGSALEYHEACAWWEGDDTHEAFGLAVLADNLALAEALGFDMVRPRLSSLPGRPRRRIDENTFCFAGDGGGEVVMKFDPDVQIWGVVEPSGADDPEVIVAAMEKALDALTDEAIESSLAGLDWLVARAGHDKAVLHSTGSLAIPMAEQWLLACIDFPAVVERHLDCVVADVLRRLPLLRKHGVDGIWAGGLLGGRGGLAYSPELFRDMLLPRLKRIVGTCHELGMWYLYRTDGNIWPIADALLAESGIDGYGVSDARTGMDIGEMRRRFPGLVLSGNVSPIDLHLGSVDDVMLRTRACIDNVRGGGHILGSANSIIHGTPAANVVAMFETAREYGRLA